MVGKRKETETDHLLLRSYQPSFMNKGIFWTKIPEIWGVLLEQALLSSVALALVH